MITVFCKPHDDKDAVLHGLDVISPIPMADLLVQDPEHDPERPHTIHYRVPDTELTVQKTQTDEGTMIIYTLFFKKLSALNTFAKKLAACLTKEEKNDFLEEPELLLDAEGKLSLRLDKELLMNEKMSLTQDGNCYQVKASIAAYPKNQENIIAVLEKIIG